MTTEVAQKTRQMPKGGRKGGSVFPRLSLTDTINYAQKLVSKTHTGPQPQDVIFSGVVGAKSGLGTVRISALRQYGFLSGDAKANYSADELAKKIAAAPPEERLPLYREAVLRPTIFKKLFDTFHGDTVSKAKLKQRAADLRVHPDETATCVDLYISGMTLAGLVTIDGEQVKHVASSEVAPPLTPTRPAEAETEDEGSVSTGEEPLDAADEDTRANGALPGSSNDEANRRTQSTNGAIPGSPRAIFNVNVTLDSSLDIEKLQKQLELLKRFGAI